MQKVKMRFLTFTTLYPNSIQKDHGLFVEHRLTSLLQANPGYAARVIAPVPWFPSRLKVFGKYAEFASVARQENRKGVEILHPRYLAIPKIGMIVSPLLLAYFCRPLISKMISEGWDFQLIDAHYFYPDGVAAVILGKWFRKPVIVTARGTDINTISEYRLPGRIIKWAARECDKVITVSDALKQKLIDLGVESRRITTLRNGVDLVLFRPCNREEARRRLGLPLDRSVLISVGHLIQLKGHHLVIEALQRLDKDTILLIIGEGNMERYLKEMVRSIGLGDRVRFCGPVSHEDLSWYYSAADVSVLASSREGMPNVLLESLACGTPVVSTRAGGAPEVVRGEVSGKLVDKREPAAIANAISSLLTAPRSPEVVREYAERFSWDATSRGQADLFNAAVRALIQE